MFRILCQRKLDIGRLFRVWGWLGPGPRIGVSNRRGRRGAQMHRHHRHEPPPCRPCACERHGHPPRGNPVAPVPLDTHVDYLVVVEGVGARRPQVRATMRSPLASTASCGARPVVIASRLVRYVRDELVGRCSPRTPASPRSRACFTARLRGRADGLRLLRDATETSRCCWRARTEYWLPRRAGGCYARRMQRSCRTRVPAQQSLFGPVR
jgi:hypothetical protein